MKHFQAYNVSMWYKSIFISFEQSQCILSCECMSCFDAEILVYTLTSHFSNQNQFLKTLHGCYLCKFHFPRPEFPRVDLIKYHELNRAVTAIWMDLNTRGGTQLYPNYFSFYARLSQQSIA